jgi:hypothetical protein
MPRLHRPVILFWKLDIVHAGSPPALGAHWLRTVRRSCAPVASTAGAFNRARFGTPGRFDVPAHKEYSTTNCFGVPRVGTTTSAMPPMDGSGGFTKLTYTVRGASFLNPAFAMFGESVSDLSMQATIGSSATSVPSAWLARGSA